MTLLVYAVGEGKLELVGAHGLGGKPLIGIERDGLTMVVTEHEVPPVAVTEANLRRYEDVVEQLMEHQTVLPARFGTTLAEPDASLTVLRERHEELRTGLAGVRGTVELGVQARWRPSKSGDAAPSTEDQSHPGTAYLKGQLSLQRRIGQLQDELRGLEVLSLRTRTATLARSDLAFATAYLVPRPRAGRFVQLAAELAERLDDVELECTGPWPPYSFVEAAVA